MGKEQSKKICVGEGAYLACVESCSLDPECRDAGISAGNRAVVLKDGRDDVHTTHVALGQELPCMFEPGADGFRMFAAHGYPKSAGFVLVIEVPRGKLRETGRG